MAVKSTPEVPAVNEGFLTLDEFIKKGNVNLGTAASFKFEAQNNPDALLPKSEDDWAAAFEAQSKRIYHF